MVEIRDLGFGLGIEIGHWDWGFGSDPSPGQNLGFLPNIWIISKLAQILSDFGHFTLQPDFSHIELLNHYIQCISASINVCLKRVGNS